jgi:uncharacterized protein YggT (Ycf19 family)
MTDYHEETVTTRTERVEPVDSHTSTEVVHRQSPIVVLERLILFLFGIVQVLIGLRILLLLVAAREGNDIVAFIYNLSDVFVAPFRGILRIDEIAAGQVALDVGAIVALVGWTVLELLVLWLVRIFRPAAAA